MWPLKFSPAQKKRCHSVRPTEQEDIQYPSINLLVKNQGQRNVCP